MVISKGRYEHGEFKNVLPWLVKIPHLPVRGRKLPCAMGSNIRSTKEICESSGLPIPIVPRLHQCYAYRKRKLRDGEFKNVLPKSVQIPYLPVRGRKLPRVMGGNIGSRKEICETSSLPIPMVPLLHQCNGYIKRKLQAWRVQKCIALLGEDTVPTSVGPYTTPYHKGQYRVHQSPWYRVCTNAMVISKGRYGHGEFKNHLP